MKATAALFGAIALGSLAVGCSVKGGDRRTTVGGFGPTITGSGKSETREYQLQDFSAIEVANTFKVDITQGPEFSVSVTTDDNLLDQLDVTVTGETLRIGMKPGVYVDSTYDAAVTLPALKRLKVSGASNVRLVGVKSSGPLAIEVSGASKIEGQATADSMSLGLSGASRATLSGAAASADLTVSGASGALLDSLPIKVVRAKLSGASNATIRADEKLDVDLSGASHLTYTGVATASSSRVTGASTLARR